MYSVIPNIIAVSPNFEKTTFTEFLDIESRSQSSLSIFEELYTVRGS